jgi:hypothetical protein
MAIQDEDFRRQSDRSVDNLRSLYAVLFGLSFGLTLTGTYDKIHGALVGQSFNGVSLALNGLVTLGFVVTLSLFHYQIDRTWTWSTGVPGSGRSGLRSSCSTSSGGSCPWHPSTWWPSPSGRCAFSRSA